MPIDPNIVHLQPELAARAGEIVRARGESLDAFVGHAVAEALAEQEAFEEAMAEADRYLEAGRTHSQAEVMAWLKESRLRVEAEIDRRSKAA